MQRRLLGSVEVDSGTLLIGDPLYVLPSKVDRRRGVDYQAVIDAIGPSDRFAETPTILIQDFGGDGTFDVYGEFEGEELLRVTIELDDVDE